MFFFIIRHTTQNTPIALSVKDLAMVQRAFGLYFGCKDTHYFSICQIFPQKNSIYFSKPSDPAKTSASTAENRTKSNSKSRLT